MKKEDYYQIIIIGGGLAGLSAAIHLSKEFDNILLIEKNQYPKHKVCGEYISNEVLPYLSFLGFNPFDFGAQKIDRFLLSTTKNKTIEAKLPLGGFGISRFKLDAALAEIAQKNGVRIIHDTVLDVAFNANQFLINTKDNQQFSAEIALGAYGKRDVLDKKLERPFIQKASPYLGVKVHVKGNFDSDLVALHNFKGGYCGVSKVENDIINLCYITNYKEFKKYKSLDEFQNRVIFQNNYLKEIFTSSTSVFDKPLTISQISFALKNPVENHMLMCGDTAGVIHPLCGNGMSMAIRGAQIASYLIIDYLNKKINREQLEKVYKKHWNDEFTQRLKVGHTVAALFRNQQISAFLLAALKVFPSTLPAIIKKTHGKPMQV